MNFYPKNSHTIYEVKKFIILFYLVGFLGFLLPFTRNFFIRITPLALLLCIYLLAVYHKSYKKPAIISFIMIYMLGYLVEVTGVNTGLIFGDYFYGSALGLKIYGTPLIIGLNWLFLAYVSISIIAGFVKNEPWIIVTAPLVMVGYDYILEMVAPKMDMWFWQNHTVPVKNYVAWYVTGIGMVAILRIFKTETQNPLATLIFISQGLFFLVLHFLMA